MNKNNQTRNLKVYRRYQALAWKGKMVPEIILKGEWLRASGFEIGSKITVENESRRLIISAKNPGP